MATPDKNKCTNHTKKEKKETKLNRDLIQIAMITEGDKPDVTFLQRDAQSQQQSLPLYKRAQYQHHKHHRAKQIYYRFITTCSSANRGQKNITLFTKQQGFF